MNKFAKLDQQYVWHPFTQMRDWAKTEPIVISKGNGAVLRDVKGREYLDGNSSIWTNLHGHNHPAINKAITKQLKRISHSSALGFANEPASELAEKLVGITNPKTILQRRAIKNPKLNKVFFSDDGSTAMEVSLKLSYECARRTRGIKRPRFLSLDGAYHGDTVGGVSLGHIDLFHKAFSRLLFKTDQARAPYCYRCPFNKAKPQRADARTYRKCNMECVSKVEEQFAKAKKQKKPFTGFVYEPLIQGAAGVIPQPKGWLKRVASAARAHGAQLIADEVMTGFGRCNTVEAKKQPKHFASHQEGVQPDFMNVAKGLTGGYLPMAATITSQSVFDVFLGEYQEFKTFFHGHSFTGNQLGASASLANLDILERKTTTAHRAKLQREFQAQLETLWDLPNVGDIRVEGLVAGVELVSDWKTRQPIPLIRRAGIRVCEAMAKRGVLTRPIGSVVLLMPPYCTTLKQLRRMVSALYASVEEVFRSDR
ncbi:MAG: adenosylmethionine--8-amino-7-oxononanoate transaminase [Verrucomicrobiales bacterium]|nr:adenosylmethionine--8-amino-7-oxononanoate transaminase [Verrucomicrobiales bacterium]|tara:strand:+ start:20 stop:1465 length:1446 start_codon:yes stop_codon:yes gene_type:complete